MNTSNPNKFQKDLNAGLLGLAVLGAVAASETDVYGYDLAKRMRLDGDASPFQSGSIYPVLRNLCAAGWLASRVVPSYAGPARRYYRITDEGRATLATWRNTWQRTRDLVDRLLED